MTLLEGDYAIIGITAVMAIMGLWRGLSGMVAFISATACAIFAATYGWDLTANYLSIDWQRGIADFVATLVIFAIFRFVIKNTINKMLTQPSDSIFGLVAALLIGAVIVLVWAKSGLYLEYSEIVRYAKANMH